MLRVFIVLPVYLAAMFFLPRSGLYDLLPAFLTEGIILHALLACVIAIVLSVSVFWWLERRVIPSVERGYILLSALRMFFVGVVVGSILQGYYLLTEKTIDDAAYFVPIVFFVAELVYEFTEFLIATVRQR